MTTVQTIQRSRGIARIMQWFKTTPMTWFNRIVIAAIIMTPIIFVWELMDRDMAETLGAIDTWILGFFVFELGVRVVRAVKESGKDWWRDKWIWIDAMIIVLALMPLGEDVLALRLMRAFRLAHISRHMPHLRHLPAMRWLFVLGRRTYRSVVA